MRAGAVRFFLLGGIALGSQLGLGGSPAMAQVYDFNFNSSIGGGPSSMSSIDFILSGTQVTGTVAGSGTGILSGGSLSTSAAINAGGYGTAPVLLSTSNAPFFSSNTPNYVFIDTNFAQFEFYSNDQGDYANEYGLGTFLGTSTLTNESLTPTPAPIPGSGILSYLVLALGGLIFRGKALWWKSVTAMGKLRNAVGARFSPPDSALAQSSQLLK
jgi:hypothetical protein